MSAPTSKAASLYGELSDLLEAVYCIPAGNRREVVVAKLCLIMDDLTPDDGETKYAGAANIMGEDVDLNGDPWKHRSSGIKCGTCMWYVAKVPEQGAALGLPQQGLTPIGRCRRHAPTMNGYPVVFPADFCGDHKLDETK